MAREFKKLPRKLYPKAPIRKESKEQLYWKSFQFPTIVKEFSSVNYINYSPNEPYDCLVTNAAKIQIFGIENNIKRTSSRSKENVYGARFRSDGKLMVTGGDSGLVQVLDVASRAILRNFNGHTKATRACCFSKEPTKLFSASDDKTARYWDLPAGKEIARVKSHKDYVRCGCINLTNNDIFITGSYDHTVKIWDTRSSSVAMTMNHGAPVECVVTHQNGSVCISSGGNYIKVWDLLSGAGRLFTQFSYHQKTITTICFDGNYKRLLSGGLDRYVKVHDISDNYALVASISYPSPILAIDLSPDGNHLAVGMADGAISFRHRIKSKTDTVTRLRKRNYPFKPGSYQYRVRNQFSRPEKDDIIIGETYGPKMSKTDRYLQKFRYREALDYALADIGSFPSYIISLLIELSRQNALELVLSNRDAAELKDIMLFLARNITNPRYAKTLIPIANLIIDKYSHMVGKSKEFDASLKHLSRRIAQDLQPYNDMMKLLGAMDQVFCMMTPLPHIDSDDQEDALIYDHQEDSSIPKTFSINLVETIQDDYKTENGSIEQDKVLRDPTIENDINGDVDFNIRGESPDEIIVI